MQIEGNPSTGDPVKSYESDVHHGKRKENNMSRQQTENIE